MLAKLSTQSASTVRQTANQAPECDLILLLLRLGADITAPARKGAIVKNSYRVR